QSPSRNPSPRIAGHNRLPEYEQDRLAAAMDRKEPESRIILTPQLARSPREGTAMNPPEVKPDRIQQMWFAYAPPLMLEAAVRNRVFDVLDTGAKSVEQVAAATGASVRGLRALMN